MCYLIYISSSSIHHQHIIIIIMTQTSIHQYTVDIFFVVIVRREKEAAGWVCADAACTHTSGECVQPRARVEVGTSSGGTVSPSVRAPPPLLTLGDDASPKPPPSPAPDPEHPAPLGTAPHSAYLCRDAEQLEEALR